MSLRRLGKKLKKVVGFEKFNLKDMLRKIKDDPFRMVIGAADPLSTKAWNKVLGKDWEPIVNELGGPTKQAYQRALEAGIDIGPGKTMHDIAGLIAGSMAGGYGMGKLGALTKGGSGPLSRFMPGETPGIPGRGGVLESLRPKGIADWIDLGSKAEGILGSLGGGEQPTQPTSDVSGGTTTLSPLSFERTRNPMAVPDYFTYGKSGGEHAFFNPPTYRETGAGDTPPIPIPERGRPGMRIPTTPGRGLNLGGGVRGPGTGRSDDIEALLSDGEYVIDAESVALLGDGSLDAGADRLDEMRENLRKHKGTAMAKGKFSPQAKSPESYMGRAKGGRIRGDWVKRVVPGKAPENRDPAIRQAELEGLRRMIEEIKKKAAETPVVPFPVRKAEGGPVEELTRFADELESVIQSGNKERLAQLDSQLSGFPAKIREYAKGGEIKPETVLEILSRYFGPADVTPPVIPTRPTPERLRQMADELRRLQPKSEVLRRYEMSTRPKRYRAEGQ